MAIIKCPECGKEISNKANVCIHCGVPISNLFQESRVVIKAQDYPGIKSFWLSVCDTTGNEIASLHTGTIATFSIDKEMDVYVKYKHSPLSEATKSNIIRLYPGKKSRLQISYIKGIFTLKLHISEVDIIDSF